MEVNNGCISDRIVTFQTARPFALNHDYGRKGNSEFTPENSCLEDFRLFLGGISATDSPAWYLYPFHCWIYKIKFNIPRSLIWSSQTMPFFSRFEDELQSLSTLWMLISRIFCGRSYVCKIFGSEQLDTSKHTIPDSCHHFLLGSTRACLGSLKQGWLADCPHIWWCELNISLCNPTEKNRTKENPGFSLDFADFLEGIKECSKCIRWFWGRFPPSLCRNFGLVNFMTQTEKFVVHSTTTCCFLEAHKGWSEKRQSEGRNGSSPEFFSNKNRRSGHWKQAGGFFFCCHSKKSGSFFLVLSQNKNPPGQCVAWDAGKQRKLTQLSGRGDEISISQVFGYRWFVLEVREVSWWKPHPPKFK